MREFRPSFWHMLLPVLGLHGLFLAYPIDSKSDLESQLKPGKPVRVVAVPPLPRKSVRPIAAKSAKPSPSLRALPLQPKRATVPKIAATPPKPKVKASLVPPKPTPTPSQPSPSPAPAAPQPSPSPTPSIPPGADSELPVEGATAGCLDSSAKDCFAIAETNGRLVVDRIETYFQRKGYALEVQPVDDEHGMIVYRLSKLGRAKDYLHVFWDEKGTTYLRSPTILNYNQLVALVRQESS
ncbi:hypothetical protein [Altericista sp. CCNU0014]|uniref:hypothetical protein n=1 Tax=Altericista sp. CCNU0014 TaxID=3082949 RepID=UPI0038516EAE